MTVEKTLRPERLEMPGEVEKPTKISRRDFLRGGAVVAGVVGASAFGLHLRERFSTVGAGEKGDFRETEEILAFIRKRYGVEIPNEVSSQYSQVKYYRNSEGEKTLADVKPNALLTVEEARLAEEVISSIPGAGYLAQIVVPFREKGEDIVSGGSYMGFQWPAFLHPAGPFPYDYFISDKAAIKLIIPEGVKMSDRLPVVEESYSNAVLTPLLQASLNSAGIKASTYTEIPWTTHGERFEQTIAHEFGHALLDKVTLAGSRDIKEYWERQTFTLYTMNMWDIDHPLLKGFAEANGWKLIPYVDFVRQYSPKHAEEISQKWPQYLDKVIWDRDFAIWGDLKNRKVRITPYASYGPIQEAFSEFWAASILYPDLLSPKERQFFGKLHQGLAENPAFFIKSIVEDEGPR